ncbi:MAG: DNA polymerase III subunit gamma/tau [Syntrophomonas sp.]|nr:DNA polymerase III subunit gamma/tau [Syntrophomonas sp.]
MAYLALYRVWRPQRFSEVVGQEQTVTALQNSVREDRLTHAYLFCGPRGTGKTSIAKILAKAVNCENRIEGEPCNVCLSCQDINNGNFMDVIEIDAASNRGIDEIRDLREKVRIMPAQGKKKVYIIDEVHMLTTEAFNALLKTLEEPPESVIFILATTEAHKIPSTILSRCQKYNFRRLTLPQISTRLKDVASSNGIEIEEEALSLIGRRANGGMRDALGMLDQLYSYKEGSLSKADVLEVLGLVDDLFVAQLIDKVIAEDLVSTVSMLNTALNQGKEAGQLARETALYLRDLLLYKLAGEEAELVMAGEQSYEFLKKQALKADKNQILQALRMIMETGEKLRFSEGQKYLLEMALLEMAGLFAPKEVRSEPVAISQKGVAPRQRGKSESNENHDKSEKNDAREVLWNRLLVGVKEKKIPTHALLSQGKLLGVKGDTIFIGFRKGYRFHKERMEEKGNREIVDAVIKEIFKREVEVQFIFLEDSQYNDIIVKKAIEYFGEDIVEVKE